MIPGRLRQRHCFDITSCLSWCMLIHCCHVINLSYFVSVCHASTAELLVVCLMFVTVGTVTVFRVSHLLLRYIMLGVKMSVLSNMFFTSCSSFWSKMFISHIKCGFYTTKFYDLLYLIFKSEDFLFWMLDISAFHYVYTSTWFLSHNLYTD